MSLKKIFSAAMRRIDRRWKPVLPVLVLGALVITGFANFANSSSGPNAQLASQDRVYGGGQFISPLGDPRNFAVDAHAGPSGQAAYGDIEYAGSVHYSHEQVTCVTVNGNKATLGAIITQADRPETVGSWVMMVLADNGTPISGNPDESTLQVSGPAGDPSWPAGFPYVCPSPDAATAFGDLSYFPLVGGDIVIHDATS